MVSRIERQRRDRRRAIAAGKVASVRREAIAPSRPVVGDRSLSSLAMAINRVGVSGKPRAVPDNAARSKTGAMIKERGRGIVPHSKRAEVPRDWWAARVQYTTLQDQRDRRNFATCKERPKDSRKSGGGPRRAFIPWCKE